MRLRLPILAAVMSLATTPLAAQTGEEDAKDIVADQIRAQGYKCDDPQSATQDAQASRPDELVWILQCEDARYRVRLIPDMAAKVDRLDGKEDSER